MHPDKFTTLTQRREPMTPDDRAALRERATLISLIGGAVFLVFFYFALSNFKEIFDTIRLSLPRTIFFWGKLVISIGLLVVVSILGRYIYRSWKALQLDHKIVYSGKVTAKRTESGSKHVSHYASLDGVEFSLDGEEFRKIAEGTHAEFHCAFPGEVFRTAQIDAPKRGKQKKTNNLKVSINGDTFTVDLNKSPAARIGILVGGIILALIFALSSLFMWWFGSYPPAALLFKGNAIVMEITESNVTRKSYKGSYRYEDHVLVSPVAETMADAEDEPPPRKKFPLQGRPESVDVWTEADAKRALRPYPVGRKITTYALDTSVGPFYTERYSFRSLASMLTGVLGALAIAGGAVYLAFRRRDQE